MTDYRIVEDDLTGAEVIELLAFHLEEMHALSPPCKVHAMPVERLREPDVTFYSAWDGDKLAAVGAIREIDATRGELKSMRATPAYFPAQNLYRKHGFTDCEDFGDYVGDEFSMCMSRAL